MRYDELSTALESIILNTDNCADLENQEVRHEHSSGLGNGCEGCPRCNEWCGRAASRRHRSASSNKGAGHKGGTGAQRDTSSARVARNAHRGGKGYWSKDRGKNRGKGREKGGNCDSSFWWNCGAKGHNAVMCPKSGSKGLDAIHEGDEHTLEEVYEDDDEVHGVYFKKVKVN